MNNEKVEKLEALMERILCMGGTPDLFYPRREHGDNRKCEENPWICWFEDAENALELPKEKRQWS